MPPPAGTGGMVLIASDRGLPEAGDDVGRDALELVALVLGLADGVEDDVGAAGVAEARELLGALLGRADDPVLAGQRLEVLGVALGQVRRPHGLGRLPVAPEGDERQVAELEARERAAGRGGGSADLLDALGVALGLDDVGDPAVTLAAGPRQRGLRAPADPDRRPRPLHGLGIDRHALEAGEAALEAGRRVAPERAHDLDAFGDAGTALAVGHATQL